MKKWFIKFEFKKQDCWIGAYWDSHYDHASLWPAGTPVTGEHGRWVKVDFNVWICLLPMLPIHIGWRRIDPLP